MTMTMTITITITITIITTITIKAFGAPSRGGLRRRPDGLAAAGSRSSTGPGKQDISLEFEKMLKLLKLFVRINN